MRASSSWPSAPESRARSAGGARGVAARAFDLGAQPELELAGGLLGEGHRDDSAELGAPARQHRDDPVDQRGGLAGAGRGLDDERGVEVVADAIAHALIGDLRARSLCRAVRHSSRFARNFGAHRSLRNRSSAARRAAGFSATRISSYGPQTIR